MILIHAKFKGLIKVSPRSLTKKSSLFSRLKFIIGVFSHILFNGFTITNSVVVQFKCYIMNIVRRLASRPFSLNIINILISHI